jgi:hypothetical protein
MEKIDATQQSLQSRELGEMMVIEINFGKGRKDEILVHFGDDPDELAHGFVKKHSLKQSSIPAVASHIRTTIEEFKASSAEMRPQSPTFDQLDDELLEKNSDHGDESGYQLGDASVGSREYPGIPPAELVTAGMRPPPSQSSLSLMN